MPPFYIGSTSVEKVAKGYRGSVKSAKYGKIWAEELELHPELFDTRIITLHNERIAALNRENALHVCLDVVKNPLYINQSRASGCFGAMSPEAKQKELATKSDPEWIETVGKPARERANVTLQKTLTDPVWKATIDVVRVQKQIETKNDSDWKRTVGRDGKEKEMSTKNDPVWQATKNVDRIRKLKATKSSPEWLATVDVDRKRKEAKTKADPKWLETVGKQRAAKQSKSLSDTVNDPVWKSTTGKRRSSKLSATQLDPEWKKKHYKTCEVCGKSVPPGNYTQWHGYYCVDNPEGPRYKLKKK